MRIWTKSVWRMSDMQFLPEESESVEYEGPIAEAKKGNDPPPAPDPYQVAGAQTQQNRDAALYNAALNRVNTYTPLGSQEFSVTGRDPRTGAPIYEQNINLSPEAQQLFDQQQQQNLQLGNIAGGMMDRVQGVYGQGIDTGGLPGLQGQLNIQGPALQGQLNTAGLPGLPGAGDLEGFRNEAESALYDRNTAYLDPRFERQEEQLRSRLANQGVVEGSEAFRNAMDDFEQSRETAFRQARNEAIAGGGAEASRMFGIGSQARGQLFGEALGSGAFTNQARGQAFGEAAAGAGLSNQARAQGMQELFALRNQPLNEFNALRSASPVNMPQFQGMAQVGTAPADIAGAIQNQYQGQLDAYNAQQQSRNALMGGLFGLGASALTGGLFG